MLNAPLVPIAELGTAESLAKYGIVGYQTERFRKLILVKIIGYITEIINSDEKGFTFLRVDDGTASILIKLFGEKEKREQILNGLNKWDYILTIGFLRHWGEELYIQPIKIKKLDIKEEYYYKLRLFLEYYISHKKQNQRG